MINEEDDKHSEIEPKESDEESDENLDFYPLYTLDKMPYLNLKSDTIRDPKQLLAFLQEMKKSIEWHNKTF